MRRPKKLFKTIDDVPLGRWNLIVICLKRGRKEKANTLLHEILIRVKDIPMYEVFQLASKLSELAEERKRANRNRNWRKL